MQWAEHLYLSEKTAAKKDRIIKKANRGIGMVSIYLIALASNPENLFDIFGRERAEEADGGTAQRIRKEQR